MGCETHAMSHSASFNIKNHYSDTETRSVFVKFSVQPLFRRQIEKTVKSGRSEGGAAPCSAPWLPVHCVQSRPAWFGLRIRLQLAGSRPHSIRESKVHCLTLAQAVRYRNGVRRSQAWYQFKFLSLSLQVCFYRTQVNLGSNLWVWMSVTEPLFET